MKRRTDIVSVGSVHVCFINNTWHLFRHGAVSLTSPKQDCIKIGVKPLASKAQILKT